NALLDPGTVAGIRLVVHAEVSPRDPASGQAFDVIVDVTSALQALDPDLSGAEITVTPGDEDPVVFDAGDVPALADIDLGDPLISVPVTLAVPGSTAKGGVESDADYIARLRTYGRVPVAVTVAALDGQQDPVSAATSRTLPVAVPILVVLDPPVATSVVGGDTAEVTLTLANVGNATTGSTSVESLLAGSLAGTPTGLGATLAPPTPTEVEVSYAVPALQPDGNATSEVEIAWTDAAANPYGPITISSDVWVTSGAPGAPTIGLALSGQTLFGTEPLTASATDDVAVTAVDLLVDGSVVDTLTAEPYLFELDTTAFADGEHTFQARAHDGDSHVATTAPVAATIDNALPGDLRVQADLAKGILTIDEAAIEGVRAVITPASLPTRYQSETIPESSGTASLYRAFTDWDDLEPETQDAVVADLDALEDTSYMATPPALLATIGDFADHCSTTEACRIMTDNFEISYQLEGDNPVALVDAWQLVPLSGQLESDCGSCNGVPDWVDRVAYGLEQARSAYSAMGYPTMPSPVLVRLPARDGRAYSLPVVGIEIPHASYHRTNPIYVARHEYFHQAQAAAMWPGSDREIDAVADLIGDLWADQTADPRWFLEATAEWAAHQAETWSGVDWEDTDAQWAPEPGNPQRYAALLSHMLKAPEQRLTFANDKDREYGTFVFAEFLEEWAAGSVTFAGDGQVFPAPAIIYDIWIRIGDGQSSLAAIEAEMADLDPASSFAEALPSYARANYLLDADGAPGTYRDGHADAWRAWLEAPAADPLTRGDSDQPDPHPQISDTPRPYRHALAMADAIGTWYQEPVTIEPGGSSYLEFKLPDRGGRFLVEFYAAPGPPLVATVMAFSSYPEPCVADTIVDLSSAAPWVNVDLPDACTSATVILTHTDPAAGESVAIRVGAESLPLTDEFEREVAGGFGTTDAAWEWRPGYDASPVGSVSGGAGRLPFGGITGNRLPVWAPVTEMALVGHLSDCSAPFDLVRVEAGTTVYLSAGGLLLAPGAAGISLPDLDPC
ncbi:MAG: Ig-like domain-containing protein, partial [Acidimicrobiales bacterium]|nr:Ig-like domain-containing protein [Acidimicrobiales bacterium]